MFIEFTVKNYRSIQDTQMMSMAASNYYNDLDGTNCFYSGVAGLPKLLRSAAIYGPNAAGKSNLFHALKFMQKFVLESHAQQEGLQINIVPFALNKQSLSEPSEFEISFLQDNVRYQYGFAANKMRIVKEWLLAYPEGKAQHWYERKYNAATDKDEWHFSKKFIGRRQLWQDATRKNALFLSTAIQLNNEQLKPVFNWFQKLVTILPSDQVLINFSVDHCASKEGTSRIMRFMNAADINIVGIHVEMIPMPAIKHEMLPSGMPQSIKDALLLDMQGKQIPDVQFLHKADNGEIVPFNLMDESDGTKRLFTFAGPWLDVLANGRVMFIDELGTSLHPLMLRFLLGLIQNPEINKNYAQLIFTTHDTSVLDTDILRRDQIWFMEKDPEQKSRLYPLSDFKPRKEEAIEKGYLKGRYGALPFIGELRF